MRSLKKQLFKKQNPFSSLYGAWWGAGWQCRAAAQSTDCVCSSHVQVLGFPEPSGAGAPQNGLYGRVTTCITNSMSPAGFEGQWNTSWLHGEHDHTPQQC